MARVDDVDPLVNEESVGPVSNDKTPAFPSVKISFKISDVRGKLPVFTTLIT